MNTYAAIWLTEKKIDSTSLLREFESALEGKLSQVYPKNQEWTGITVFERGGVDHLGSLPVVSKLVDEIGRNSVLGITYFNLAPHSTLHRHRDMNGNLLFGVMRLHVPLKTNEKAKMEVERRWYHMPIDTLWALDTSGLHALENSGDENRIHLVLDVKYGLATARYFPKLSPAVLLHLTRFVFIVVGKLLRDILIQPSSLILRIRSLLTRTATK